MNRKSKFHLSKAFYKSRVISLLRFIGVFRFIMEKPRPLISHAVSPMFGLKGLLKGFFIVLLLNGYVQAQLVNNPGKDDVYRDDEVAVIRVVMDESDKAFILAEENKYSDEYKLADISFKNSKIDEEVANVGIRIRGNTSRSHLKKSFKINFRTFGGEKFHGFKKFNLKAENNDASMIRELMSLKMFRDANVPAARSSHAELYINDEYMGLYLNVEQIDDEFTDTRFGTEEGNLYKCYYSANLKDVERISNDALYELKTNEEVNDRSILEHFVDVLNNTPTADFADEIELVFNVESMIRYLAAEALIGHWDGYAYNQNNFYLYENPETQKMEFIPYDVDNTFGLDFLGQDWGTRNISKWYFGSGGDRPLANRILGIKKYFDLFVVEINRLLSEQFNEDILFPEFDAYKNLLDDAVQRDTYYTLKYGFDHQSFLDSHHESVAGHAPYGLRDYVLTRSENALAQLPRVITSAPQAIDFQLYPNPLTNDYHVLNIVSNEYLKDISVIDNTGRTLEFDVKRRPGQVSLTFRYALNPGVYFVKHNQQRIKFYVR